MFQLSRLDFVIPILIKKGLICEDCAVLFIKGSPSDVFHFSLWWVRYLILIVFFVLSFSSNLISNIRFILILMHSFQIFLYCFHLFSNYCGSTQILPTFTYWPLYSSLFWAAVGYPLRNRFEAWFDNFFQLNETYDKHLVVFGTWIIFQFKWQGRNWNSERKGNEEKKWTTSKSWSCRSLIFLKMNYPFF